MKKTSIYLDPDLDRALAGVAAQEGIAKAEVIRRALLREVAERRRPRIGGIGAFEGPGDVARNVDRYLERTGFGDP